MQADPEERKRRPPAAMPVVAPTIPGKGVPAGDPDMPVLAPLAGPPVLAPLAGPPLVAPLVGPRGGVATTPVPVVAPLAAPARPVRAPSAPVPAPVAPAPVPAPAGPPVASAARVEKHGRAADRVVGFTGLPTGVLLGLALFVLNGLAGFFSWRLVSEGADDALRRLDLLGAAAARVLAMPEIDWWKNDHGTSEEMRRRVQEGIERERKEAAAAVDPRERDTRVQQAEEAGKRVQAFLADRKGVDDLQRLRNEERFRKVRAGGEGDPLLGAEVYDENRRPLGRGFLPTAVEPLPPVGAVEVAAFSFQAPGGGVVRARRYVHPVEAREMGSDQRHGVAGYVGVFLSAEPAHGLVEKAHANALLVLAVAGAGGLLSLLLAMFSLLPLRRVLRDAEEFSRGNLEYRPGPAPGGEVGALARAVSRTVLAARDRETEALAKAAAAVPPPPDHRPLVTAALAPSALLRIPQWEAEGTSRPSLDIAGDTFDFAAVDGTHFAALLLETSVRGLPAAFLALEVRTFFRALCLSGLTSPRAMLEHLGAEVGPRLPQGGKVSALVAVIDTAGGEARIASAGASAPVAWRAAGRAAEAVDLPGGPDLAASGGPGTGGEVAEAAVPLAAGDRLVFFSDGVTRARNARREAFGDERLRGLVQKFGPMNSTAFVNMVVNDVDLFHEGAAQRDDLTVSTVRRLR